MELVFGITFTLVALAVIFGLLERWFATWERPKRDRRTLRTDLTYWFLTPLVSRRFTHVVLLIVGGVLAVVFGREVIESRAADGWGPILLLPKWAQILAVLLIGDLGHYWGHRLMHTRLWKFHSIHHAPTSLDWLAATRVHPLDDVVGHIFMASAIFALGAPMNILAVYVPLIGFISLLGHSNVPWDFGPFRGVIASPRFHRWHHTSEEEGRDKNFAAFFPLWDRVFGTYYMPPDREPSEFGVTEPVPDGVWGQLKYPFRRENSEPPPTST